MPVAEGRSGVVSAVTALALLALLVATSGTTSDPEFNGISVRPMATSTPHAPILIVGNSQFTAANGVVSGKGTANNPYVISNWTIDATNTSGVEIDNTNAYFEVLDVQVQVCCGNTGVSLNNVAHGSVVGTNVTTSAYGIGIIGSQDVTVSGGSYAAQADAADIWGSDHVNVSSANLVGGVDGVWTSSSSFVDLWYDRIVSATGSGIALASGDHVRMRYLSVYGTSRGIEAADVLPSSMISHCFISTTIGPGIVFPDTSLTSITGNTVNVTTFTGVELGGNNVTFSSNTINTKGSAGVVVLAGAADIALSNNLIDGGSDFAVQMTGAARVTIRGNDLHANARGILLDNSTFATIQTNTLGGNGVLLTGTFPAAFSTHTITPDNLVGGQPILYTKNARYATYDHVAAGEIIVAACAAALIANETINGTESGVEAAFVGSLSLSHNTISNATWYATYLYNDTHVSADNGSFVRDRFGLYVFDSSTVTVTRNLFLNNTVGVLLRTSSHVLTYANNFTLNGLQATDDAVPGVNAWDEGYPTGGNYWSDYRGWDDCHGPAQDNCTYGDGLGDFPYTLSSGQEDRYPLVYVNPPKIAPVVLWAVSAPPYTSGTPISFDASGSYDPTGWPLKSYLWTFGDGSNATSAQVATHAYASVGNYTVILTVTSVRGLTNTTSATIMVQRPPPPPTIPLVIYTSPRGYIVPVPRDWSRTYNLTAGNQTYELFLRGTADGAPANMLVDTEPVSGVQETDAYLTSAVQQILSGVHQSLPDAYLEGTVSIFPLSGHLAATFEIGYTAHSIVQLALIVVSQAHEREWSVILTGASSAYPTLNTTFANIVQGFTITLEPPSTSGPPSSGPSAALYEAAQILGVALIVAVPIILILVYRARRRPPPSVPYPPQFTCTRCSGPMGPGENFCGNCGSPVTLAPPPMGPPPGG